MITSDNRIKVKEIYKTRSLGTRRSALLLADEIRESKQDSIVVDFDGIAYASLSFLDQLNSEISTRTRKKVELTNLSKDLKKLLEIVRRRAQTGADIAPSQRNVKIGTI
jgi:hypothetical protein